MSGPFRPDFGTYENPLQPGITEVDEEGKVTYQAPTRFRYPTNQFFDFLTAQIESTSTKLLASPTLIIQEGEGKMSGSDGSPIGSDGKIGRERVNEALVSVGQRLVTSYSVKEGENGSIFCEPELTNAGLTFGARVDKIDDNGFVTFRCLPKFLQRSMWILLKIVEILALSIAGLWTLEKFAFVTVRHWF